MLNGSKNWRSTPDDLRSAKNGLKRSKNRPPPPYPRKKRTTLFRTGMSTDSSDELNLRHFHCRKTTSLHDHRDVFYRRNCTCGTSKHLHNREHRPPVEERRNNGHVNDLVQDLGTPSRKLFHLRDLSMICGMMPRSAPHRHDDLHTRNTDSDHLVRARQLRDLRSFVHSDTRHLSLHTTGMQRHCPSKNKTSCNCGSSTVFSQTAPEELAGPALQRHQHLVNELQLENLNGFLHRQDHEDRLRVTTGMSTTLTSEDCALDVAQQRACQTWSKNST